MCKANIDDDIDGEYLRWVLKYFRCELEAKADMKTFFAFWIDKAVLDDYASWSGSIMTRIDIKYVQHIHSDSYSMHPIVKIKSRAGFGPLWCLAQQNISIPVQSAGVCVNVKQIIDTASLSRPARMERHRGSWHHCTTLLWKERF